MEKVLNIDLLVIDLETCKRCVPTGDELKTAVQILEPAADALGIELRHHEIVVQTAAEAKLNALVSSPTIRLNGRDIDQDIHESVCESCGDLTENETIVDCREWHYRGQVFSSVPLPLLIEAIMEAMLNIDQMPPLVPAPLEELPVNLQRYFDNKKQGLMAKEIEIYDPAMCCSTGVCGPSIDPELMRVATTINSFKEKGIIVQRYGLSTDTQRFISNPVVSDLLEKEGAGVLPVTLLNGEVVKTKSYPTDQEFTGWLKTKLETVKPPKRSGCC
ncbi:arsenite efflux transporter metallochaperone ArsD [Dehalogenimonas alkenigignens]|uniref:Arsenical resistance operon trans-acting repressor ArsD n=1 Tax=Dehalogenimonas alkenigignens TaxID=1217799 RepID=A0A0W0GHK4_9CHLR|nr:arsenite efflux transporter metallochaperone ArsD [Dehalogenimonas alkenigignens]KTB48036.1 protein of unknown function (DUF2703)/Arsenical resistance operon trans-acting repressor ArsD [Dehalogenimonas alkenigignens]PVV84291.1 arsenical resistance operon transcriptional repressor ArsD [Dehalogenimonas alkenigignens]